MAVGVPETLHTHDSDGRGVEQTVGHIGAAVLIAAAVENLGEEPIAAAAAWYGAIW